MRSCILLLSPSITRILWLGPVGTSSASSSSPCEQADGGLHVWSGRGKRGQASGVKRGQRFEQRFH